MPVCDVGIPDMAQMIGNHSLTTPYGSSTCFCNCHRIFIIIEKKQVIQFVFDGSVKDGISLACVPSAKK